MPSLWKKLFFYLPFPISAILAVGLVANTDAFLLKFSGNAPDCPWSSLISLPGAHRSEPIHTEVIGQDDALDLVHIRTPLRAFWVKRDSASTQMAGQKLIDYLVRDHRDLLQKAGNRSVRRGDTVIDCGAHVGVFTAWALEKGASRVVSIEPDPKHVECLRRNFRREIEEGRVVVVPKGVWSEVTTLELFESSVNSGSNSVVQERRQLVEEPETAKHFSIPVTTIDTLARDLGLNKVALIKMDIEGAERNALAGARATIVRDHPRLVLDSYHRPDDMPVFRQVIRAMEPRYAYSAEGCEPCAKKLFVPHVTYWAVE